MSLIAELQRRNVFRVTAAYLALGWIVAQVTGLVAPALHLPETILSTVVWVGVIGLPFVIMFAWAYEITPEGLKRESEVDRSGSITHLTARRLDYLVIGMIGVGILLFAVQMLRPGGVGQAPAVVPIAAPEETPAAAVAAPGPPAPEPQVVEEKSIAVLPFVNMSDDKANEYFSDGIAEELLNVLAKIPELRVIARTSSFAYKGKETKIAEIARELHVANILEGSVRKSGNRVRITAQLVRASDSTHLWSETYDRTLDDIFAVQEDIAGAVVGQLRVTLLGALPAPVRDLSPEAYAQLLQAEHFWGQGTPESMASAQVLFQKVLAKAPQNARAWTGMGRVYFAQGSGGQLSGDEAVRLTRDAVDKALEADPDYAPAHALLGLAMMGQGRADMAGAAGHIQRALELDPNDPATLSLASRLLANLGRLDESIVLAELVTQRDPVSALGFHRLGYLNMYAGRWDTAIAAQRSAQALSPGFAAANYHIGVSLLCKGDAQAALKAFEAEQTDEEFRVKGRALAYFSLGQREEFERSFAELRSRWGAQWPSEIAQVYAWSGDADATFEWLDKSIAQNEDGLVEQFRQPLYFKLHDDPRWSQFRERSGTGEAHLGAIPFEVRLPK